LLNYNEPFYDPLSPSEETKQNEIRAIISATTFTGRQQGEINARPANCLKVSEKKKKKRLLFLKDR
jgi:hypothetical protein